MLPCYTTTSVPSATPRLWETGFGFFNKYSAKGGQRQRDASVDFKKNRKRYTNPLQCVDLIQIFIFTDSLKKKMFMRQLGKCELQILADIKELVSFLMWYCGYVLKQS